MRKDLVKRVFAWVLALFVALCVVPGLALAKSDPTGVNRVSGTDATSTEIVPGVFGTISLDPGKLNINTNDNYIAELTDNFEIGPKVDNRGDGTRTKKIINYMKPIPVGTTNLDDVLSLTFPDTATLEDGSKADVKITYSNITLENRSRTRNTDKGGVTIDTHEIEAGASFFRGNFVGVAFHTKDDVRAYLGMTCDFKLEVLDKDGNVVDGTILFEVVDLDVANAFYENEFVDGDSVEPYSPSDYVEKEPDFREALMAKSGMVSPAYIPETNFLSISGEGTEDSGNGIRFSSSKGDSDTLNSGFVALVENGTVFKWWGSSGTTAHQGAEGSNFADGMGTALFTAKTIHILKCTTTKGGTISQDMTSAVTKPGDEGSVTAGAGSTVTYTFKPEPGYELAKVLVDGEEVTPVQNEDGSYTYTFDSIDSNHRIDVSWDPIVTATTGTGGSISDPGDTTVPFGSDKTYTFTPEPGYIPDVVTVNGKTVTPVDNGDGTWSYTVENVTEPTKIDVQWKKAYTVTFVDGFGNTLKVQTGVPEHGAATAPANPKKPGYDFVGWDVKFDDITGDLVVTALWKKHVMPATGDPLAGASALAVLALGGIGALVAGANGRKED